MASRGVWEVQEGKINGRWEPAGDGWFNWAYDTVWVVTAHSCVVDVFPTKDLADVYCAAKRKRLPRVAWHGDKLVPLPPE